MITLNYNLVQVIMLLKMDENNYVDQFFEDSCCEGENENAEYKR